MISTGSQVCFLVAKNVWLVMFIMNERMNESISQSIFNATRTGNGLNKTMRTGNGFNKIISTSNVFNKVQSN